MTVSGDKFGLDLQALESHLVAMGYREPREYRLKRKLSGSDADLPKTPVPVARDAFCMALILAPLTLGACALIGEHPLLGGGTTVLRFIGFGTLMALPAYFLIGAPIFWDELKRHRNRLPGRMAEAGFIANFATLPLYTFIFSLPQMDIGIGAFIGGMSFFFGLAFAPVLGALFGAYYRAMARPNDTYSSSTPFSQGGEQ